MNKELVRVVENGIPGEDGRRPLLHWVLQRHPDSPKGRAKQWILGGRVSVGGAVVRQPHLTMPDPGESLRLLERCSAAPDLDTGWQIHPRLRLLFLDTSLAVVNKGAGLLSVPAPNGEISALSVLEDYLSGRLKPRDHRVAGRSLPPGYRRLQPLPVHRLDQHTSGVFCLALHPEARRLLIEQLKSHTMRREYIGYVDGKLSGRLGTWRHWVQLSADEMRQQVVSAARGDRSEAKVQEAVTHYEVLAEFPVPGGMNRWVTKLRLRLETGRKHQIRAQAAHMGVPLVGDRVYHPGYRERVREEGWIEFPRQALHAEVLSLEHPRRMGERMEWRAPLPADLRELEAGLRAGKC